MKTWLPLFILAILLAACAPNPIDLANAERIKTESQQKAKNDEQARQQQQKTFEKQQALVDQFVASAKVFIRFAMFFSAIAACIAVLGVGIGVGIGAGWGAAGVGRAVAILAETRARLVYMDQNTMHFPLIEYAGKGFLTITDVNTGETRRLDTRIAADRQMIAESFGVRKIGVLAEKARRSDDPAGMAMIGLRPVIADVSQSGDFLQVGNMAQALIGVGGENE